MIAAIINQIGYGWSRILNFSMIAGAVIMALLIFNRKSKKAAVQLEKAKTHRIQIEKVKEANHEAIITRTNGDYANQLLQKYSRD